MAQFAVLIYAADPARAAVEAVAGSEHDDHAADLAREGVMTAAWELTPADQARSVRASGTNEGPFLETAEAIAGFYLLEAPGLDAAVAIAARNPAVVAGGGVEVRPVLSGGPV